MSKISKGLIIIALLAISVFSAHAQGNTTISPYTRYGYGVLSDKGIGASRSMGGISYGLRTQNVNPGNPASYASVDTLTFIFDVGVSYTKARLSQSGVNAASQTDDLGGLDYIAMQFKIARKFGFSAGYIPYSSVGYSFGKVPSGSVTYQTTFSGSGDLNQVYGGVAYGPLKGFSVGANISYLYGNLNYTKSENFSDGTIYPWAEYRKLKMEALKFDIGIQYDLSISRRRTLTLGAVYSPEISPSSRISGVGLVSTGDSTLVIPSQKVDAKLPHTFGFGFTVSDRRLIFGTDVTYQKWKDLDYPGGKYEMNDDLDASERFNDRWKVNAGIEYTPNYTDRSFFKRMKFRAGANYSNSYINIQNSVDGKLGGYNEYGGTIGFGLPFRDYNGRTTYINIGFEYTRLSPEFKNTMVKEEYFGINLNVNFSEMWFWKNRFK